MNQSNLNPKDQYKQYREEVGKDALKALALFFFWLPLGIGVLVWLFVF